MQLNYLQIQPLEIVWMVLVSILWGVTNPFLGQASKTTATQERNLRSTIHWSVRPIYDLYKLLINWRFSLPFLINNAASVLFTILVVQLPITLVVTSVNSLTFIVTAIVGAIIGESPFTINIIIGSLLILVGIILTAIF